MRSIYQMGMELILKMLKTSQSDIKADIKLMKDIMMANHRAVVKYFGV